MLDLLSDFALRSALALKTAGAEMVLPALIFFTIGVLTKGRTLFTDMQRAVAQTSLNVQIMVFNIVLIVPLIVLASQAMSDAASRYGLILISPETWRGLPFWLVIFIGIFIGDFVGYWRHRLEHTPLLWPAHAVHHSDTDMTWLSLERFHPINRITTFAIDSGVLLVLGLPIEAVLANNFVRHYYGYFIHADLPWTFGPLGRIFVSPAMHRWHHAADPAAFDTNYATVFSVFDQAFGTFRVPGPCTAPLGVTDAIGTTLSSQLSYAFVPRAYRRLFKPKA